MSDVFVAALGSGVLVALINNIFSLWQTRKAKQSGVASGTRMILYDRIKFLGKKYIAQQFVSSEDLEDIMEMHRIYHDELGGNGFLDEIMQKVKSLKIKE